MSSRSSNSVHSDDFEMVPSEYSIPDKGWKGLYRYLVVFLSFYAIIANEQNIGETQVIHVKRK